MGINDDLSNVHLFRFKEVLDKLLDNAQFLQDGKYPKGLSEKRKKILEIKEAPYTLIKKSLYKVIQDDLI